MKTPTTLKLDLDTSFLFPHTRNHFSPSLHISITIPLSLLPSPQSPGSFGQIINYLLIFSSPSRFHSLLIQDHLTAPSQLHLERL
ncbi:hypothetical protein TWF506_005837 [Arthrobotrys conoides]|uniref:Uncharacterized protein n=1 Tax=Arthrobotrys conoides TaxID=74498 RepID=A0AAN8S0F7_9PEZI